MILEEKLITLTKQYGNEWGLNHSRRILRLIDIISGKQAYNKYVVMLSTYLHDWGAYNPWKSNNVPHDIQSVKVADTFLKEEGEDTQIIDQVKVCIEKHHAASADRPIESILLSDADALDYLGVIGILRDVSKNPRELGKGIDEIKRRMPKLKQSVILDKSKEIALQRVEEMNEMFDRIEKCTFGFI